MRRPMAIPLLGLGPGLGDVDCMLALYICACNCNWLPRSCRLDPVQQPVGPCWGAPAVVQSNEITGGASFFVPM